MVSCDTSNEITTREKQVLLQHMHEKLPGISFFYFCHWSPAGVFVLQICTMETKRKLTQIRKNNKSLKF